MPITNHLSPITTNSSSYVPTTSQGVTKSVEKSVTQTDAYLPAIEDSNKKAYARPEQKKLTSEQIQALKEQAVADKAKLLETMMGGNTAKQAGLATIANSHSLPTLATTKEGAKASISDGGPYSIDAVATRIMDMAKLLADGDPSKIDLLQNAVKKGFKQAGLDFEKSYKKDLPQISKDTYDEIMKRFEAWKKPTENPTEKPADTSDKKPATKEV